MSLHAGTLGAQTPACVVAGVLKHREIRESVCSETSPALLDQSLWSAVWFMEVSGLSLFVHDTML